LLRSAARVALPHAFMRSRFRAEVRAKARRLAGRRHRLFVGNSRACCVPRRSGIIPTYRSDIDGYSRGAWQNRRYGTRGDAAQADSEAEMARSEGGNGNEPAKILRARKREAVSHDAVAARVERT